MKHAAWLMLFSACALLFASGYVADWSASARQAWAAAPPLSLEGLLDEKLPEAPTTKEALKVDNFACYVCHGNYDGEEMVVSHGKEGTGCVDCHGKSFAHRNDEDNITPPDKMYAREAVDKMCAACHDTHDAPARKVLERWQERCPQISDPKAIVCTDCHYQHRLARRTVVWNKKTGELILREKVEPSPPAGASSAAGP